MDSHVVRSHVGEEEEHHEKKSVLNKVKAKAKKLKETIKGHHHDHDQEGQQTPDDHDPDEEDDEDDDPEVHGVPIYDSAARRTDAPVQGDILKVPMRNFGDTRAGRDEYDPKVPRDRTNANVSDPMRSNVPGLHGTTEHGAMHNSGTTRRTDAPVQGGIHFGATHHEHDSAMPGERTSVGYSGPVSDFVPGRQYRTTIGHEDLLGGARTKLVGPTTGPVLKHEEPKGMFDATGGGTHTPRNTPVSSLPHHGNYNSITMDVDSGKTSGSRQVGNLGQTGDNLGKTDVLGEETPVPHRISGTYKSTMDVVPRQTFVSEKGGDSDQSRVNLHRPRGFEEDPHAPKVNPEAYSPSNYETKVTDPTKSGGREIGVTPMLHSFDKMNLHGDDRQYLNDGGNQSQSTRSHEQFSPENQGTSYTETISSATSAIADKAISAKNAVASRLGYGGTETVHDDYSRGYVTGAGKSGSSHRQHQNQVLDPSTNQSKPAETPQVRGTIEPEHNTAADLKPSNQTGGTYTERISSATSAVADKAISAKTVVASKLGYVPSDQVHEVRDVTHTNVPTGTTAADQHGKTITSTVAEKLTPVYEKVAGAGTAVMSKIPGVSSASTDRDTSAGAVGQAGQDKGVSVKDYFAEKLKPGEEDRALSEVISEKLQKHKPGVKEHAGHSADARPMGKVTESQEVRQRLGTDEGNENFVVEKIKASVGSLLGGTNKSDEGQRGLSSRSAATGDEDRSGVCMVEHRRLQEN
ncbi:low-temperature-induced 65 kDa protein-like isoform X2 [Argentina anserina]|uniref:low-temperature-induced 65 kDa protein-like isoform X2 n=1 Tax=Argentina anserina TaxID=57926 RepID=UPI0021766726|nr:low-temperature-induced 65 kDa protein-like isoform X2 [Potentilla anserina]